MALYRIKSLEELREVHSELAQLQEDENVKIDVVMDDYSEEVVSELKTFAMRAKEKAGEVEMFIDSKHMDFHVSDMEKFIDLEDKFDNESIGLYFQSADSVHTLNDALNAQAQIDEIITKINKTNASPLEKYLMAYTYVTSKIYKEAKSNLSSSRELISILNSNDIVCVGYARLMDRICKGIGIKSHMQIVGAFDKSDTSENQQSNHANNIVYIKDEKYGIDGYYYTDACWDSKRKPEQYKRIISRCLIPLSDKDKMKFSNITVETDGNMKLFGFDINYFYGKKSEPTVHNILTREQSHKYDQYITDEDKEKVKEQVDRKVFDVKKRKKAVDVLIKLFKNENIPADVYQKIQDNGNEKIPLTCDFHYMLALLMQDKVNPKDVAECVQNLKLFYQNTKEENQKKFQENQQERCPDRLSDVYETMHKMKNEPTKTEEIFITDKDGVEQSVISLIANGSSYGSYDTFEVIMAIDNNDEQVLKDIGITVTRREQDYLSYEWRECKFKLQALEEMSLVCEKVKKKIQEEVKIGKPIPIEAYRQALKNSYIADGMEPSAAEYSAEKTIETSVRYAELVFEEDASNCFRAEALARRREQNLEESQKTN